ncbi:hypothetical protein KP509_09G096500 [Ceratopteris richardii]|uniref:Cyclin n=1 Tax=Ceratopteris richardii TaxID=49495 RepID=A0A8T2U9C5_CERRI|nr:hypothetical protein KP509_09G096500 [Ceratopteris richardii]
MGETSMVTTGQRAGSATSGSSPRVLAVLSSLLQRMVTENDKHAVEQEVEASSSTSPASRTAIVEKLTVFHGQKAPSISVEQYVERIFIYANCSPSCFVVAYAYLDRIVHQQRGIPITSLNVHRLLITSVMIAAKFLDDSYYNNAYYGKVGGVSTQEMNRLELEFLFRLGFRLHITLDVFDSYCSHLERELASYDVVAALPPTPEEADRRRVVKQPPSSYQQITHILESVS